MQAAFFLFGFPRNGFGSFDITSRCNLRCRHCYYYAHEAPEELSDEQWVELIESLRRKPRWEFPFLQASWVGGEPLLRKRLVGRLRKYFRFNTVVTNGLGRLPDWPDVRFYVSVDGPEKIHEQIRGRRGIYGRIKENADRRDLSVTIACCLNRINAPYVEEMLVEWSRTNVSHMVFDFYTPTGKGKDPLWLDWPERDRIVEKLMALKRHYGDFIVTPMRTFRLMKSDLAPAVVSKCLFRKKGFAFASDGTRKAKCTMGPRADCSRCGCVVPYYMASLTWRKYIVEDFAGTLLSALQTHFTHR